jgi:hypothetical protein
MSRILKFERKTNQNHQLKPCKNIFINTPWIWKMYKGIGEKKGKFKGC